MLNTLNAKRRFITCNLLVVSTLGTVFFLLETKTNAAVIGKIQGNLTFAFSPTDPVFLDPGQTQKLVSVGALSTLTGIFSTDSGGAAGSKTIVFSFSGGEIINDTKMQPIDILGAGSQTETIGHQFSQNFLLGVGTYTVTSQGNITVDQSEFKDVKQGTFTVAAVPEPLTILGSGVALGFGALFKKEYSKKHKVVKGLKKQKV
jgi:hypothetical protein